MFPQKGMKSDGTLLTTNSLMLISLSWIRSYGASCIDQILNVLHTSWRGTGAEKVYPAHWLHLRYFQKSWPPEKEHIIVHPLICSHFLIWSHESGTQSEEGQQLPKAPLGAVTQRRDEPAALKQTAANLVFRDLPLWNVPCFAQMALSKQFSGTRRSCTSSNSGQIQC